MSDQVIQDLSDIAVSKLQTYIRGCRECLQ